MTTDIVITMIILTLINMKLMRVIHMNMDTVTAAMATLTAKKTCK